MEKIGYLGIPGSYSHVAAEAFFGPDNDFVGQPSFPAIFRALKAGDVSRGIVPIENTLAGSIYDNYDLLGKHHNDAWVIGEYELPVKHNLVGTGATMDEVSKVYSHPKALEQCAGFFEAHPQMEPVAYSDTATAARYVGESNDPTLAAIAGEQTVALYGLRLLAKGIEDKRHNFTRFLAITNERVPVEGADKCSVVLRLPHVPGSLKTALDVLAETACNLTKIESRPHPDKAFEYVFYLDFRFDEANRPIEGILGALKKSTTEMKNLGVYVQASRA